MELARCSLARGNPAADGTCLLCGSPLADRRRRFCSSPCSDVWSANHYWHAAREWRLRLDQYACVICADTEDVEVHHRQPCRGNRGAGCRHHLDRLETLCRAHHAEQTRAERARPGTVTQLTLIG